MTAVDRVSYSLSVKGLKNQPFYEGFIPEETNKALGSGEWGVGRGCVLEIFPKCLEI
jgi:hypothetical protein